MIKAVVFDFDGLIIDTETPWYDAFREIYGEHGVELPLEVWAQCVGTSHDVFDPYDYLEQCIGKPINRDELRRRISDKHAEMMEGRTIRPGVEHYLRSAKSLGLNIGLASSSTLQWVERFLKQFDLLHYFQCIRTADGVKKVKPDPELYVQALECLGVSAGEAVAFEDSPNGARAAKSAGMRCVIVPNPVTAALAFDQYDLRLESMADMELQQVIERLNRE